MKLIDKIYKYLNEEITSGDIDRTPVNQGNSRVYQVNKPFRNKTLWFRRLKKRFRQK